MLSLKTIIHSNELGNNTLLNNKLKEFPNKNNNIINNINKEEKENKDNAIIINSNIHYNNLPNWTNFSPSKFYNKNVIIPKDYKLYQINKNFEKLNLIKDNLNPTIYKYENDIKEKNNNNNNIKVSILQSNNNNEDNNIKIKELLINDNNKIILTI